MTRRTPIPHLEHERLMYERFLDARRAKPEPERRRPEPARGTSVSLGSPKCACDHLPLLVRERHAANNGPCMWGAPL